FQAEDGIRDKLLTGVQTCALPIFPSISTCSALQSLPCFCHAALMHHLPLFSVMLFAKGRVMISQKCARYLSASVSALVIAVCFRSEERRVGKECRWWGGTCA